MRHKDQHGDMAGQYEKHTYVMYSSYIQWFKTRHGKKKSTFVLVLFTRMMKFTSKKSPRNKSNIMRRRKVKYPVWVKSNQREGESRLLWTVSLFCTRARHRSMKRQSFESGFSAFILLKWRRIYVELPFMSGTHLTYSADFQKCPGWERRRFLFGNFSNKSTSLEKLGRSSCLNAQHRSRMSWKTPKGFPQSERLQMLNVNNNAPTQ